jgi:catechol 2,3-dioxygenase
VHDVARIGHAELLTPKPAESLAFFTDVLGMEEETREGQSVYLRGWGEWARYSLKLTEAATSGLGHIGLRAWSPEALERRAAAIEATGLGHGWIDGDIGHGRAYQFEDPDGHRFELYYEAERYRPPPHLEPSWRNQPQRYTGRGACVKRLDHVNVLAADVRASREFAQALLGYRLYERIELDDGTETGAWLSLSIAAHELIYVADHAGARGRLHHLAFWVDTREECLARGGHLRRRRRRDRSRAVEARRRAGLLPLRLRARRQPDRGDDRRLLRLRPGPRADHVDGRGARPRPVLGRADDRELPHLRHPAGERA